MYPHLPLSGVALDADRLSPAEGAWVSWWVRPDGTGRHDDGAEFTVRPALFRGGARLMGGWQ